MHPNRINSSTPDEIPDKSLQEIREKYDSDSLVRKPTKKYIVWFISILAILFAAFHLYTTFYPLPTLQQRAFHLLMGMAIVFLLYPTFKKQDRTRIPYYDWYFYD